MTFDHFFDQFHTLELHANSGASGCKQNKAITFISIFTHRCFISQCEQFEGTKYSQDWLQNALPGSFSNGKFVPEGCYEYNFIQNINDTELTRNNTCFADLFGLERQKCNSWIFSSDEVTIVNDVSLVLLVLEVMSYVMRYVLCLNR